METAPDRKRRFCASLKASTLGDALARARTVPAEVSLVELRADLLTPEEAASGGWTTLPAQLPGVEWIFTWRSPREGGGAPRPRGVLALALESGFSAVDVEEDELERGEAEASAVPPEKRWVSRHRPDPPAGPGDLLAEWTALRRRPAALHKLVVPAQDFRVNDWVLALGEDARREGAAPCTLFAEGPIGHVSRILGYLRGNAVTYLATAPGEETAGGQPTIRQALAVYQLPNLPPDPRLYGVLGARAGASRSPELHNHAFRLCGERALYLPLPSPDPAPVLAWLASGRLRGLSVTMPHKQAVLAAVERLEPGGAAVGAVNTLWIEEGRVHGANTDLEAAAGALVELKAAPGDPVALIGAGGAAAAVLHAAVSLGLDCRLYNRTPARAEALCARLGGMVGGRPADLDPETFRVVVNATPLGAAEPLPQALARADWSRTAILDLAYGGGATELEGIAAASGGAYIGGLDFLVRQAAGQFRRWTRRRLAPEQFAAGLRQ